MTRYLLINGQPTVLKQCTIDGITWQNPTEAQIEQSGDGYPIEVDPMPEYDSETERIDPQWVQEPSCIRQQWTVSPKSNAERIEEIDSQIAAINEAFGRIESEIITYPANGKQYQLGWCSKYYAPLLLKDDQEYPTPVADITMETTQFSKSDLQALYNFLIAEATRRTMETNARLAELFQKKHELEG